MTAAPRSAHAGVVARAVAAVAVAACAGSPSASPTATEPALRAELLRRVEQDQAVRRELIAKGMAKPDPATTRRMNGIDADNTARMQQIVATHGWPGRKLVGADGSEAAFLLVQHADLAFQQQVLPLVEAAWRAGDLRGQDYALLTDRVLVGTGHHQRFGTQLAVRGNDLVAEPIDGEADVDARRATVGLPPMAEYLQQARELYFPPPPAEGR